MQRKNNILDAPLLGAKGAIFLKPCPSDIVCSSSFSLFLDPLPFLLRPPWALPPPPLHGRPRCRHRPWKRIFLPVKSHTTPPERILSTVFRNIESPRCYRSSRRPVIKQGTSSCISSLISHISIHGLQYVRENLSTNMVFHTGTLQKREI